MDINYYQKNGSVIPLGYDTTYIHSYILLSDTIMYASMSSALLMLYINIDSWKDEAIEKMIPFFFPKNEENEDILAFFNVMQPLVKKLTKQKHKDKNDLVTMGQYKEALRRMRKIIKLDVEEKIGPTEIIALIPFVKENIWQLHFTGYMEAPNQEDFYIPELTNIIINREILFAFDSQVDTLLNPTQLDAAQAQDFDFISIPLWNMPHLLGMTYEQLQHSRENLQKPLTAYKNDLKELSKQLFPIDFSTENMQQIKQLCTDRIIPYQNSIQKDIDDCLYISQLRNRYPKDFYATFCLGITSAENLVSYYEKTKNVEPYVATQIKERISRHIHLKATYVFTYFQIHVGAPLDFL